LYSTSCIGAVNASHVEFAGDCGQYSLSPTTKARIEPTENGVCAFATGEKRAKRARSAKMREPGILL